MTSLLLPSAPSTAAEPTRYGTAPRHEGARAFLDTERPETPALAIDLRQVDLQYNALRRALPEAKISYATAACPAQAVLKTLAVKGAGFSTGTRGELEQCLAAGIDGERVTFANPVTRTSDIAFAFEHGVQRFTFDSEEGLRMLARHAPGAKVLCRITGTGEDEPRNLTGALGCAAEDAATLLVLADRLGLQPAGVALDVGTQQMCPERYSAAIGEAAGVFASAQRAGVRLTTVDVGGGFPAHHEARVPALGCFAAAIRAAAEKGFAAGRPELVCRPGRALVADAGVLRSTVILVARRRGARWVHVDVGRFSGLSDVKGEAIRYALRTSRDGGPVAPAFIAGPTGDDADVLQRRRPVLLPIALSPGDTVDFLSAGAYTMTRGYADQPSPTTYVLR